MEILNSLLFQFVEDGPLKVGAPLVIQIWQEYHTKGSPIFQYSAYLLQKEQRCESLFEASQTSCGKYFHIRSSVVEDMPPLWKGFKQDMSAEGGPECYGTRVLLNVIMLRFFMF